MCKLTTDDLMNYKIDLLYLIAICNYSEILPNFWRMSENINYLHKWWNR